MGLCSLSAPVFKALGFTDVQIAQKKSLWIDKPEAVTYGLGVIISVKQSEQLRDLAESQGTTIDVVLNKALLADIPFILSQPAPSPKPK